MILDKLKLQANQDFWLLLLDMGEHKGPSCTSGPVFPSIGPEDRPAKVLRHLVIFLCLPPPVFACLPLPASSKAQLLKEPLAELKEWSYWIFHEGKVLFRLQGK